jgi:hypothetical protein
MRTLNLSLISATGAFALLLTIIALPTLGERPLSHWALTVGAFSSAALISLFYFIAPLISESDNRKSQKIILASYLTSLILSTITGAFWSVVGHVMETESVDFKTAFWHVEIMVYGGYFITTLIFISTIIYLIKQRKKSVSNFACV